MPTILLIRHGENEYTRTQRLAGRLPNAHLNERGRAQAAALAEALKGVPLKAIYSSPLERAVETAQPIARLHGLRVQKRPGLIETDLGSWQGQSIKKLQRNKEWKLLQEHPSRFRFPGGEWMAEQQSRLVTEIESLCALHTTRAVIACVGHADPIKLIIAHYVGMPLDLFQRLNIDTASISTLALEKGRAKLINLNWKPENKDIKSV
ncbi:MAG: histidine phosphatase family protein [Anaerolineales bacterium]